MKTMYDIGLPNLSGSVKQVAWAEKIRERAIAQVRRHAPDKYTRDVLLHEMRGSTAAREWIDNREQLEDYNDILDYYLGGE